MQIRCDRPASAHALIARLETGIIARGREAGIALFAPGTDFTVAIKIGQLTDIDARFDARRLTFALGAARQRGLLRERQTAIGRNKTTARLTGITLGILAFDVSAFTCTQGDIDAAQRVIVCVTFLIDQGRTDTDVITQPGLTPYTGNHVVEVEVIRDVLVVRQQIHIVALQRLILNDRG